MAKQHDTDENLEHVEEEGLEAEVAHEGPEGEAAEKLQLDVKVESRGACERHVTITVPREEVEFYYDKEFSELVTSAQIPGFRPGHAPRKLIEARFRKDVSNRVKSNLMLDAINQVTEEQDLTPIGEPRFDLEAVVIPDDGPMIFEYDIEVRPEFDVPQWKGLTIERPVREFSSEDIDRGLENLLARRGKLVPHDGPAEMGDYITTNLRFEFEGQTLSSAQEEVIRIRPVLSFRDGNIENFGEATLGVRAGESRTVEATLTEDAPNAALRGKRVTAVFEVLEVKKLQLPELDEELLDELGGFENEGDLRDAIRESLEGRLEHVRRQRAREQITKALTASANWELPTDLLRRQASRELQRALLELQSAGYSDDEIRAYENALRQTTLSSTARAMKEHFILEKIAESESIEVSEDDYQDEIERIAFHQNESARRIRARLEKSGQMDVLHNQVVEHKVVERILEHATFKDVPWEMESAQSEAIDQAAGGGEEPAIPEAQEEPGETSPLGPPPENRSER